MASLEDFEDRVGRLEQLKVERINEGEYGERIYDSDVQEACFALRSVARQIRGIAWSGPFEGWARELANRAESSARRIGIEHGLMV